MQTLVSRHLLLSLGLCAAAGGLLGCEAINDALTPSDSEEAAAAADSVALTRLEASLLMAIAEQTPLGSTPEEMATAVEAALPMVFSPADCVRGEAVEATVTMTLEGCTGPRDLSISGVVNVVYAVEAAESVTISVTAADLEIDEATLAINATGTYEMPEAGSHRAAVSTQGGGTAPGGRIVGRLGAYVVEWQGECYGIDGEWTSSLDDEVFVTTVNDYYVCEAFCPAAGSIIYGKSDGGVGSGDISGTALTITYIGDEAAPWVATDGSFGRQALQCSEDPQGREAPGGGGDDDDDDIFD